MAALNGVVACSASATLALGSLAACSNVWGFGDLHHADADADAGDDGSADVGDTAIESGKDGGVSYCDFAWTADPSSPCETCSRQQCAARREACVGSQDCCNFVACYSASGDQQTCQSEYPAGIVEYCAYVDCATGCGACSGIVSPW